MSEHTKSRNMKDSIPKYLGQVVLIVFSVVLGLYLSEKIEDRKNVRNAQELFSKIDSELKTNKQLLDNWVPYHKEIIDRLDILSNDNRFIETFIIDKSEIYEAFTRGTIMSEMPSSDAWDIAKAHPLMVNIDYDKLLILSKVYNQQEFTYESIPEIIDLMISPSFNSKDRAEQNVQLFRDKLQEVYGREIQLLNYYNEAVKL